jgi:serine protease Do
VAECSHRRPVASPAEERFAVADFARLRTERGSRRAAGAAPGQRVSRLCACLFGLAAWASVSSVCAAGLPETIARVKLSVVAVGTEQHTRNPPSKFMGTGFVVGDGRHVITNAHVLPRELDNEHREFLAVFSSTGKQRKRVASRRAEVVATDRKHDLALLKAAGKPLPALRVGDSGQVREGERYAFTGFPIGPVLGALYPVTHEAIVSALTPIALPVLSYKQLTRKMRSQLSKPFTVFQLDAVAYPGNSGSPMYSPASGKVVAVINAVYVKETRESVLQKPSGITYAIPARYVGELLKKAGVSR